MRVANFFGFFLPKKQDGQPAKLIQGIKFDPITSSQLQLMINKKASNLKEQLEDLKGKLNMELWHYKRMKCNESLMKSLKQESADPVQIKKMPTYSNYVFSEVKENDLIMLTVKGGDMECTINCLLRDEFCDTDVIPDELKLYIPSTKHPMTFNMDS